MRVCLIENDSFAPDRMKPASYEMRLLGELYDWEDVDGRLRKRFRTIDVGDRIELPKNSISYLWTREQLLLPEYIAARFNLRIREVHKGILLGTGPLIDPGFGGRLLIPLHNLTNNDYELCGGQGIIWVEFTKVSKNDYWSQDSEDAERSPELVPFPSRKVIDDPSSYLSKAGVMDAGGVQSAFKAELDRTRHVASEAQSFSEQAAATLEKFEKRTRRLTFWGGVGGVVASAALLLSAYAISIPVIEKVHRQSERIGELERSVKELVETQSKGREIPMEAGPVSTEEGASQVVQPIDAIEAPEEAETPLQQDGPTGPNVSD